MKMHEQNPMTPDKLVLITGSTDGIGKQTAIELIRKGFNVIIHGRNDDKVKKAKADIARQAGSEPVDVVVADLSSLREVHDMAVMLKSKYDKLDVLINNAGVYQNNFELSRDGFEMTFAVNHLAHFVLTLHLLPLVEKSSVGRIINVSSMAHASSIDLDLINSKNHFNSYTAYGNSKLCNLLFTYQLARLGKDKFTVNALHPGVISTKLLKKGFGMGGRSLAEGAATSVFLASSGKVNNITGRYYSNLKETSSARVSYDQKLQYELWKMSLGFAEGFLPDDRPDLNNI